MAMGFISEMDNLEMNSRFDTFSLPWNDFSYLKKGSEIEFNHKKYDIYSVKRVGDVAVVAAFIDEVESALGNIVDAGESSTQPDSNFKNPLPDWVGLHVYSYFLHNNSSAKKFIFQQIILTKVFRNIVLPPPECIA